MLDKIQELLKGKNLKAVTLSEEVQLESLKTAGGDVINAAKFEAGEAVTVTIGEEENPLPVGEYEMEDGAVLVVEEEGIIAAFTAKAEEKEEEPAAEEELSEEDKPLTKADLTALLSEYTKGFDAKLEALKTELSENNENKELLSKLQTELSELQDEPASKSLNKKAPVQNQNFNFKKATPQERLAHLTSNIS